MNKKNLIFVFAGIFLIVLIFGFLFVSGGRIFLEDSSESASISSLKKGLVGHWTLDEINYNSNTNRVTDKSAYSNHGTNYGATFVEDRMGNAGGAMSFDGVDDYIEIEDSSSTDEVFGLSDTYTISAWAYANSWANWATIINKANGGSWSNTLNGLWAYTSGYRCVMGSGVGGNPAGSSIGPGYNPGLNEWHHISCVADGATLKIYVDGVYRGQSSISSLTYPRSDLDVPVVIGRRAVSTSPTFNGKIDEIRAYNRALSEKEINLLYDSYKPKVVSGSTQKGLILDMPLSDRYTKSETAGSEIITDRTPSSNDGQNYGATLGSEGASFDGSGTVDGVTPGDNILITESVTNTNNYPEGITYSVWLKVDTDAVDRMSLFFGGSTIRHIELYSSSKKFRTEAARQNGYSFGTGTFPEEVRGVWSHFVIVFANGETNRPVRWYQNGELFHTGTMDGGTYPGTEYFSFSRIGRSTGTTSYNYAKSFDGQISNLRIYDRALSADEVRSLYDKGRF